MMAMSLEQLREIVGRLQVSAGALGAVAAALDARSGGSALSVRIEPHVAAVLAELGVPAAGRGVDPNELKPLLAEARIGMLQAAKLLFGATREPGWHHTDPKLLRAAGEVSAGFPRTLQQTIAPQLDGLLSRLEAADSHFLDIGVGIGALAIGMARAWPRLHVVGIDPWEPALDLARESVRSASLTRRIELRRQRAEELSEVNVYDLAWLPSAFVPREAIAEALERVQRALRPGGWLLFAMIKPGGDPLAAALTRLRTALFGGYLATPEEIETELRAAGFEEVRALASPPSSLIGMVAARRHHA
jgi:SAM-dependent methyltransferase